MPTTIEFTALPVGTVASTDVYAAVDTIANQSNQYTISGLTTYLNSNLGTLTAATWHGTIIGSTYGGTGVNNGSSTITIGGNLTLSGAYTTTFTITANTSVTFPTSGTLATTSQLPSLPLSLANGGTGANLTASADGIVYCGASALAILASPAGTNFKYLQAKNATAPSWSGITWPASIATNQFMYANATSQMTTLSTANFSVLITSSSGVPSFSNNLPAQVQANIGQLDVNGTFQMATLSLGTATSQGTLEVLGSIFVDRGPSSANPTDSFFLVDPSVPTVTINYDNYGANLDVYGPITALGVNPAFVFNYPGAATDEKLTQFYTDSANGLVGQFLNDNASLTTNFIQVKRSGYTVSAVVFPSGDFVLSQFNTAGVLVNSNLGVVTSSAALSINTLLLGGGSLDASALFEMNSTTQGYLPPRMTTTQRNAISSPAEGLQVYDSTLHDTVFYNGSAWVVGGSGSGVTSLAGTANEIAVSGSTGAVTISMPSNVQIPSTLGVNGANTGGYTITNHGWLRAQSTGGNNIISSLCDNTEPAIFFGQSSRGTIASPTQTMSGDPLCLIGGGGYTSSSAYTDILAYIRIEAEENFTNSANGTLLAFYTTPVGTITAGKSGFIDSTGGWSFGPTGFNGTHNFNTTVSTTSLPITPTAYATFTFNEVSYKVLLY